MGLLGLFKRKPQIKGAIGYFGLVSWWLSTFTETERQYIEKKFQPLGGQSNSLTEGNVISRNDTVVGFLHNLAGWFAKEDDRHIAYKILEKAGELLSQSIKPLDIHFYYQSNIQTFYKDRDKPGGLEKAIMACRQQIEYAPIAAKAFKREFKGDPLPSHKGYQQLAIILEKQNNYQEVIDLCTQAQKQGWAGDWENRIERCNKKLVKQRK